MFILTGPFVFIATFVSICVYSLLIPIFLNGKGGKRESARSLLLVYIHWGLLLVWSVCFLVYLLRDWTADWRTEPFRSIIWNLMGYISMAAWLTGTVSVFIYLRRQKPPLVKWYLRLWIPLSIPLLAFMMLAFLFL